MAFVGVISVDAITEAWARLVRRRPDHSLVLGSGRTASVRDIERMTGIAERVTTSAGESRLVILVGRNGPGYLAGLLALWRSDRIPVLVDSGTPIPELERVQAHLGCSAVLRTRAWPEGDGEGWLEWQDSASDPGGSGSGMTVPIDDGVFKVTSGTTGDPRAVMTPARSLLADDEALTTTMGLGSDDRFLAAVPLSHSYGFSSVALPAIVRGTQIIVPESSNPFGALEAAVEHSATFLPTTPAYLQALVRSARPPQAPSTMRLVIAAGAPLAPETARRFRKLYGQPVHVFYGASECGGITYDREGSAAERGTLGTPVDDVSVELEPLESEAGTEAGERGVVVVRSAAVANGYFPSTEGRLGEGRYRTADLGSWRDGELVLHGRVDRTINVKGKKVDPGEVERLLRRLPGVREAAVVALVRHGAGSDAVRAVVAVDSPNAVTVESLRRHLSERLPPHKVPRSFLLVNELPRNERGKLDYRAMTRQGRS